MSFSFGSSKTKSKNYSNPTFKFGDSGKLASDLISTTRSNLNDGYRQTGGDFLSGMVKGEEFKPSPNSPFSQMIRSIEAQNAYQLPQQLANTRSQYMRTPAGAQGFGLDDTVLKNNLLTNQLTSGLRKDELAYVTDAAKSLLSLDDATMARALQTLGLLRGSEGGGTSSTSGAQGSITGSDILSFANPLSKIPGLGFLGA